MKRRDFATVLFFAALGCLPLFVNAQQRPARDAVTAEPIGTGSLSGTVVTDTGDERPVRRALISLTAPDAPAGGQQVLTDDAGRFTFVNLRPGRFMLAASKPGMIRAAFGAK